MSSFHHYAFDGSRGWATRMWDCIEDEGVWGIPRSGLVFRKNAAAKQLTLVMRMPWFEGLSVNPDELNEMQEDEIQNLVRVFASIGVTVMPLEI